MPREGTRGGVIMEFNLSDFNWGAIAASVLAAQGIATVWFVVLFGEPWAKEYGAPNKRQHTQEVPLYTYAVQVLCTAVLVLSLAVLHRWLAIDSVSEAVALGLFVSVGFCVATGLPGQAFLKRWRVALMAYGCQTTMILGISVILGAWR